MPKWVLLHPTGCHIFQMENRKKIPPCGAGSRFRILHFGLKGFGGHKVIGLRGFGGHRRHRGARQRAEGRAGGRGGLAGAVGKPRERGGREAGRALRQALVRDRERREIDSTQPTACRLFGCDWSISLVAALKRSIRPCLLACPMCHLFGCTCHRLATYHRRANSYHWLAAALRGSPSSLVSHLSGLISLIFISLLRALKPARSQQRGRRLPGGLRSGQRQGDRPGLGAPKPACASTRRSPSRTSFVQRSKTLENAPTRAKTFAQQLVRKQ